MSTYHRSFYHGRKGKNESFRQALRHASRGLLWGFLFEANVRRQLGIVVIVALLGWWLKVTPAEWAALGLAAALVLVLELINSSIEALADAVHPDYSEHIQRSKDLSAGAVLGASFTAFLIGLYIFLPALIDLVR
jgi:diacylglycerol kinase